MVPIFLWINRRLFTLSLYLFQVFCLCSILIFHCILLRAQSLSDGAAIQKNNAGVLPNYGLGDFNQWEDYRVSENQSIAKVNRNLVPSAPANGISDKLNVWLAIPFVYGYSSEPNGAQLAGIRGGQNIVAGVKYRILKSENKTGEFAFFGAVGFSRSLGRYLSDYMPYSMGIAVPELLTCGIAEYRHKSGIYLRSVAAYLKRGAYQTDRNYDYNKSSYYSSRIDVPDALHYNAVIGSWFLKNTLKVELAYSVSQPRRGTDVRAYNTLQPTNKTEASQLMATAQYYPAKAKGLGLLVGHSQTLDGRNVCRLNNYSVGLTYRVTYFN